MRFTGGISRQAWGAGIVLGAVTLAVDTLMAALGSPEDEVTACFNFLLSILFYSLSGYLASALTGHREQGLRAGIVASVLVGLGGAVAIQFIGRPGDWSEVPLGMLVGLVLNVPIGAVFGYLGGNLGGGQE